MIFVHGCLLDGVVFGEAAAAASFVSGAFDGTLDVAVLDGDADVEGFVLRDGGVGNSCSYVCTMSAMQRSCARGERLARRAA